MGEGCYIRKMFHVYCPGCGGTRALKELLHFHILQSFYDNPCVIALGIYLVLLLVLRFIERSHGNFKFKFNKTKIIASVGMLAIIIGNVSIRNYLLLVKGIDLLGDILVEQ